jgi:peptidyl-prolyl cis-trans isomerase SurA
MTVHKKTGVALCLIAALVVTGIMPMVHAQRKVLEKIVARVNDDIITLTDYNNELARMRAELSRMYQGEELEKEYEKLKDNALENIIQNKLLVQKAKEMGFAGKIDLEVSSYVESFRKQNNIPDVKSLERALAQAGMSMSQWREEIKNSILQEALIGTFVQSKVVTTDEEIQKYYEGHKKEFAKPAEVEVSEIIFYLEGNKESDVQAKAEATVQRLKNGEDFAEVAKKVSEGPTAKQGGNIGGFKYGTMAPDIQKAVFSISAGQYTSALKTKFGFQILKVNSKKEAEFIPLDEVKKNIQSKIYYDKYRPLLERFLKEVRDESFVEIYKQDLKAP